MRHFGGFPMKTQSLFPNKKSYFCICKHYTMDKEKAPKEKNRSKRSSFLLLPQLITTLIGTFIGIFLTIGVTYCSEKNDKEEMARKSVLMTIHNLDVSIRSMETLVGEMARQDSIFSYVRENYASGQSVGEDTLDLFISSLYSHNVHPIDTSAEDIFSTNFEIWRYIDDPKVIGRIANCYSIMNKCASEYERIEKEKYDSFINFYDSCSPAVRQSDEELAQELLSQNRVIRIIEAMPAEIKLLRQLIDSAKALNERNKKELGVSQAELDEIGELI